MKIKCDVCGVLHEGFNLAIPVDKPTDAARIAPNERPLRTWTNGEAYVIDDVRFFIYGSIELPILGHEGAFAWGAWAQIDERDFFWYENNMESEDRHEYEFDGRLATDIPFYEPTEGLDLIVEINPIGQRPTFQLEDGRHLLINEQRSGVSTHRIEEIKQWFDALKASK